MHRVQLRDGLGHGNRGGQAGTRSQRVMLATATPGPAPIRQARCPVVDDQDDVVADAERLAARHCDGVTAITSKQQAAGRQLRIADLARALRGPRHIGACAQITQSCAVFREDFQLRADVSGSSPGHPVSEIRFRRRRGFTRG
jgi:hypothetical protein